MNVPFAAAQADSASASAIKAPRTMGVSSTIPYFAMTGVANARRRGAAHAKENPCTGPCPVRRCAEAGITRLFNPRQEKDPPMSTAINKLEKRLVALEKDSSKGGSKDADKKLAQLEALVKAQDKRLKTLETIVKALAASSKSGGADSVQIEKSVKDLTDKMEKLQDKKREAERAQLSQADFDKKISEIEKKKALLETATKALAEKQKKREKEEEDARSKLDREREKKWKEQEEANKKLLKEQEEMAKKMVEQAKLEARLGQLEGMLKVALAK